MTRVGIIGAGVMGKAVAITCAAHGFDVVVCDTDAAVRAHLPSQIRKDVRRYRMMPGGPRWNTQDVLGRIEVTSDLADLRDSSWVVENIVEKRELKEALFRDLAPLLSGETHVAINTSCIPITRLAALLPDPSRVVGMHFMNPVPLIEGIEVIRGQRTSPETVEAARAFADALGKTAIVVNDMPGFVSNRLSHLFMNEAAFLVQDGVADPGDVDAIFRLGYGHRMGPLETADLIGLDTVVDSLAVLYDEYQDPKFRRCPLLKRMVDAGDLGRKAGRGFYPYPTSDAEGTR